MKFLLALFFSLEKCVVALAPTFESLTTMLCLRLERGIEKVL